MPGALSSLSHQGTPGNRRHATKPKRHNLLATRLHACAKRQAKTTKNCW